MSGFITPQDTAEGSLFQKLVPINLTFRFSKTTVGMISLDVLLSEKVTFEGKVTQYPVEDGSTISDHIIKGSRSLIISGTQSVAEGYAFDMASGKTRLIDAMLALEKMHEDRALVSVTTGLAVYRDLGIESMTATRVNSGERDGNWLDISIELKHVKKVALRTAEVPAEKATDNNGTKKRVGSTQRNTSPANAANRNGANAGNNNTLTLGVARALGVVR